MATLQQQRDKRQLCHRVDELPWSARDVLLAPGGDAVGEERFGSVDQVELHDGGEGNGAESHVHVDVMGGAE